MPYVIIPNRYRMAQDAFMQTSTRRRFPPPPFDARALILRAHPNPESFNSGLAEAYADAAAAAGLTVETVDTDALDFDLRLRHGHAKDQALEPALRQLMQQVEEAAHIVVASPVWWGSVPASFKGLIDRLFLPGWAFRSGTSAFPERGLRGRTARVLLTMDAPGWWDRFIYGKSASRQLEKAWLEFVGMKSLGVERFTAIEKTDAKARQAMLDRAARLGARDAAKARSALARLGREGDVEVRQVGAAHGVVDENVAGLGQGRA